ncbi:MAG: hypothetical protein KKG59_06840 [Nanoarchaeota archaeon]|nr:hypothetical protein [Nanoarchaeota archaeon]
MDESTENGTRFEIWLDILLKSLGQQEVMRNVEYRKGDGSCRQVDLQYLVHKEGQLYQVLVEAKYSSNGSVPFMLRKEDRRTKTGSETRIDNIVDEVWDRHQFVNAHQSLLVTNSRFPKKVIKLAKHYGIGIIEGDGLQINYEAAGGKGSINDSIKSVEPQKYRVKRNVIYI